MTEDERAYERYRRYKRAKWKSDSYDTSIGLIVTVIVMALLAMKFGIH